MPLPDSLVGSKKEVGSPLTRMAMDEFVLQDILSLVRLEGRLKYIRVSLIKNHSSLLKSFSKSILRAMLACLPFFFPK